MGLFPAIQEAEISTQTFGQCRAMHNVARIQDSGDMMHRLRLSELVPDLVLNIHGRHRSAADIKCSASLEGHGWSYPVLSVCTPADVANAAGLDPGSHGLLEAFRSA